MAIAALMLVACLSGIGGLLFLSQATSGVGLIAFGCLAGIVARLLQADAIENKRAKREKAALLP